jgi:hypothetical protein
MTIDSDLFTIFSKECISSIIDKLKKTYLNTKKGAGKFTLFEMLSYKSTTATDNLQHFDIYCSEDEFYKLLTPFASGDKREIIQFNYNNYFMEQCDGKSETYKIVDQDYVKLDAFNKIYVQSEKIEIDPASFSCRDKYNKLELKETRCKISEKAPIYLSFIHNKTFDKYYIKLWFVIDDYIDIVLEELGGD